MTTHLEYVTGALGERTALPCACGRVADHQRLGSAGLAAASADLPLGAGHATGHRRRAVSLRPLTARAARGRHAA
ncbi:hypothetical protein SAMN05428970_1156 [Agromyces sp. CF514]|uniref:hypothetical protein n=1 Tax=Agromyces sp. CF514 TaxID=1881031 RepID=UPI0008F310BB|nr:hypothetical protein [Agromyces sp. CF514]SFR71293.1 hypothetical protein SAMN05428970_1156 [Agromyces sp. CF514]